jgi:predicted transcriptional regulator
MRRRPAEHLSGNEEASNAVDEVIRAVSLDDYSKTAYVRSAEEQEFILAIAAGLADIEVGRVSTLEDVERDLDPS